MSQARARRVMVVGMSGSGKTTAARAIGSRLGLPFHEIDALAIGPGWSTPPDLRERITAVADSDAWVVDSWGPPEVRAPLWSAADTVVWLDYPRRVVLPRLLRRSLRRSWSREPVYAGNVERWRDWLGPDHPLRHAVATFEQRRTTIRALLGAAPQARTVRLTRPGDLDAWLAGPQS